MSYSLSPLLKPRFFVNSTNAPLVGGKLFTYYSGTTTLAVSYSNGDGTENTNPIILDANGECNLYLDDDIGYRLILKDANDVVYFDRDNLYSIGNSAGAAAKSANDANTYKNQARDYALSAESSATTANTYKNQAQNARTAAEESETNASESEVSAAASAASALNSETDAAASATAAETARDAANAIVGVFSNTTTGLAGTTSGQFFGVISANTFDLEIYKNNAGVAVSQHTIKTKAYFDALFNVLDYDRSGYAFAVVDESNNIAIGVKNDEVDIRSVSNVEALLSMLKRVVNEDSGYTASDTKFGIVDAANNLILSIKNNDIDILDVQDVLTIIKFLDASIVYDESYNQSGFSLVVVDAANNILGGFGQDADVYFKGDWLSQVVGAGVQSQIDALDVRVSSVEDSLTTSNDSIVAYGDSITQGAGSTGGQTFPAQLSSLITRPVANRGLGGQDAAQIISRQGGFCTLLSVTGQQIPANGAVTVTAYTIHVLFNATNSGSITGSLAGVAGTLSWTSAGGYVFTRSASGSVVTCFDRTPFIPDAVQAHTGLLNIITIGRNNFNSKTSIIDLQSSVDTIIDKIESAISIFTPLNKRFLIGGVLSLDSVDEYVGTNNYNYKRILADYLNAKYPKSFVDLDLILRASGTGSGQDAIDVANGITPSSLRADTVHPNNSGYAIIANAFYQRILLNGW